MRFEYLEPTSLDEARDMLQKGMGELKALSGGTDIVIQLRRRVANCRGLVNLKRLPGLGEWAYEVTTGLRVGACTPMRDLETSATVRERFPSLWEALRVIGSLQLRNLASVGGNLCNASPSADTAPPLMALGATVTLLNEGSAYETLPVEDFFSGPGASILEPSGVLVSIGVATPAGLVGDAFERFTPRSAMDIAIASAAAQVTVDEGSGRIHDVRIALGAVAPTPMRARGTEDWLRNKEPNSEICGEAGRRAMSECRPIDDIRGSGAYRRGLVRVLVSRVLQRSAARARTHS